MADFQVAQLIDALHAAESASLLQRVAESESFVCDSGADDALAVQLLVDQEREHMRWLVDLLDQLHATPGPRHVRACSADLHFNRLDALVGRLLEDKKHLIGRYESAAARVGSDQRVSDVIAQVLARHRDHLSKLQSLQAMNTA